MCIRDSDNYIEVIPEFDMPGHTLSVLAAYPELSCKGKPLEVGTKQGIFDDIPVSYTHLDVYKRQAL